MNFERDSMPTTTEILSAFALVIAFLSAAGYLFMVNVGAPAINEFLISLARSN